MQAVAAKEAWFLPADLWEPQGPWVLLSDEAQLPLALTHVEFFGGRSTFFVFLRLPEGRKQTLTFLDDLRKRGPDDKPLPLPSGTQVALVRQMLLIDDRGRLVTTNVTESLQMRDGTFELKLSRRAFLAGKPSLKRVGEEDRERAYLLLMGNNIGNGSSKVLESCGRCHGGMNGINSVLSYQRFKPLPLIPTAKPTLVASTREDVEMLSRVWKANHFDWGLLQGMMQNSARD
jgi:hypothetical protein